MPHIIGSRGPPAEGGASSSSREIRVQRRIKSIDRSAGGRRNRCINSFRRRPIRNRILLPPVKNAPSASAALPYIPLLFLTLVCTWVHLLSAGAGITLQTADLPISLVQRANRAAV